MHPDAIPNHRLASQHIGVRPFAQASEVVQWMGAMQAQDYFGALWAIALRTKNATEATIESAIATRTIVRTWPMRGTLHFIDARSVHWMIKHFTTRPRARATIQHKKEGLTITDFKKSRKVIEEVLSNGKQLTRDEIYLALKNKKIACDASGACILL